MGFVMTKRWLYKLFFVKYRLVGEHSVVVYRLAYKVFVLDLQEDGLWL